MKVTSVSRRIDDTGRIVVPAEIRRLLNITEYNDLIIYVEDNKICIEKILFNCSCCGDKVEKRTYKMYNFLDNICIKCIKKITEYNNILVRDNEDM